MKHLLLDTAIRGYSSVLEAGRRIVVPILRTHPRSAGWDLDQRSSVAGEAAPRRNVWIHAASLGEAKVATRFLDILLGHEQESTFLLTATTRTGLELLKTRTGPRITAARILPLDTLPLMLRMLDTYGISRVWLLETELWPSLLWACMRRHVPVGIVNARMEVRSYRRFHALRPLVAPLFAGLDVVLAQSPEYLQRFLDLGVRPEAGHVTGNLKSLTPIESPPADRRRKLRAEMGIGEGDYAITAGCIHPGEAAVVGETARILTAQGLPVKLCVVPRHLRATVQIMQELGDGARWLDDLRCDSGDWRVCVVEKMGVLDDAYAMADAAIVGGTFVPVGGHNVWDAARFAIPVFFGPVHHTQQHGCETLLRAGAGVEAADAPDLAARIASVRGDAAGFAESVTRLRQEMSSRQYAVERFLP